MKKKIIFNLIFVFATVIIYSAAAFAASSVMIIANKAKTYGALSIKSPAVKSAVQRIASYFTDKGIGVFDEEAMNDVYGEIEQAGRIDIDIPDNDLIALALKKHAEVLVKAEVFAIPPARGDETISCRVIAKMFDVSTGRLFAMSEQYASNVLPNERAFEAAVVAAASKAGALVGRSLYKKLKNNHPKILARLVRNDTPEYLLAFSGFQEEENDTIIDTVYDELGLDEENIREKKVTSRYVELEIFTDKNFGRLVRKLKRILKRSGINIVEQSRDANKVVFVKKGQNSSFGQVNIQ